MVEVCFVFNHRSEMICQRCFSMFWMPKLVGPAIHWPDAHLQLLLLYSQNQGLLGRLRICWSQPDCTENHTVSHLSFFGFQYHDSQYFFGYILFFWKTATKTWKQNAWLLGLVSQPSAPTIPPHPWGQICSMGNLKKSLKLGMTWWVKTREKIYLSAMPMNNRISIAANKII